MVFLDISYGSLRVSNVPKLNGFQKWHRLKYGFFTDFNYLKNVIKVFKSYA